MPEGSAGPCTGFGGSIPPSVFAAANRRNQDRYPRRTIIAPHNRPVDSSGSLDAHGYPRRLRESTISRMCTEKYLWISANQRNLAATASTIATTLRAIATRPPRGLRPLPDPNAVGDGTDGPSGPSQFWLTTCSSLV